MLLGGLVLQWGLLWVVGNGESIRVWADSWFADGGFLWVSTDRGERLEDWRVSALLDSESQGWNMELIRNTFEQEDVNRILSITHVLN